MSKLISGSVEKNTCPLPSHPKTPGRQGGKSGNPGSDGVLVGETAALWSPGRARNSGRGASWGQEKHCSEWGPLLPLSYQS